MILLVLAILWVILSAWVIGVILAAGWPEERPRPAPDPYAAAVQEFRTELNDWDRRGGR